MTPLSSFPLWSDEPSELDLLAFEAVAATAVDAVLDDVLDPLALGISGPWGSGKTTVLKLIAASLTVSPTAEGQLPAVLVLETDPWRYDPAVGAKESLISEVLDCLQKALTDAESNTQGAIEALKKLAKRVDWAKALSIAARASLTLQLPSIDDITSLVKDDPETGGPRGLEAFRSEFAALMNSSELDGIHRLVVLVDDLDRCLPETVVETLEAIRLFLAVPKMSFVIAADEQRVADAIRTRFPEARGGVPAPQGTSTAPEEPARLYLHKIVQTTIPLPTLSRFDTEAYLVLLQLLGRLTAEQIQGYISKCDELRRVSGSIDDLTGVSDVDISAEMLFASRLTPILYEKMRGNPRRIKRFLNDLRVRQSIASRRGITLEPEVVAKLMVLELLLPEGFALALEWLAEGRLREQIDSLEESAGRPATAVTEPASGDETAGTVTPLTAVSVGDGGDSERPFSEELIRWAKLPPALSDVDLTPYLYLAASIAGTALLDSGLPERLRDIASNLLSGARVEQRSVTNEDLTGMTSQDAGLLVSHLGRAARDRPTEQTAAVQGMLRIVRIHSSVTPSAVALMSAIPSSDVQPAVPLLFATGDLTSFRSLLEGWMTGASGPTTQALRRALAQGAS